jgi:hypothetical protein
MNIEHVPFDEFPRRLGGAPPQEEFDAVRALKPGEHIRFPCRWEHPHGSCVGCSRALSGVRGHGFKVETRCREGYVHVRRPTE